MYWETLPKWFWTIYYLFLLTTIGTAIFCLVKNKLKGMSTIAIFFSVTVPIISIIKSIGRTEGLNELEHFVSQLQQGSIWPIITIIGYLYIIVWWVYFLKSKARNQATMSK
jgi:hypothetical protein